MDNDNLVRIGIQKRGGHMFDASCALLRHWWDFKAPEGTGAKGQELTKIRLTPPDAASLQAWLLTCRIDDIIHNIVEGDLDIGFVSSDSLSEWQAAAKENLGDTRKDIQQLVLAPAGSRLMIGVAQSYLAALPEPTWQSAIIHAHDNALPIFTTFAEDLKAFLQNNNLPVPPIKIRKGTIEAQARLAGAQVIADLVESGKSMRDNGFIPIEPPIDDSKIIMLAAMNQPEAKRPAVQALFDHMARKTQDYRA